MLIPNPKFLQIRLQKPYKRANTGVGKTQKPTMDRPGPGQYPIKLGPSGPQYQFGSRFDDRRVPPTKVNADGSRFDSALRAKPHLKPKKVDGPGPGDYKLPSSIRIKERSAGSIQESTFGTGREPDHEPNQNTAKNFVKPGPAHYNHVYADVRSYPKPHQEAGYKFQEAIRDI